MITKEELKKIRGKNFSWEKKNVEIRKSKSSVLSLLCCIKSIPLKDTPSDSGFSKNPRNEKAPGIFFARFEVQYLPRYKPFATP